MQTLTAARAVALSLEYLSSTRNRKVVKIFQAILQLSKTSMFRVELLVRASKILQKVRFRMYVFKTFY